MLIKYLGDTVVSPAGTEWFEYFAPGSETHVEPLESSRMYAQDWVGLRALHEAGRVAFVASPGDHLSHLNELGPLMQEV